MSNLPLLRLVHRATAPGHRPLLKIVLCLVSLLSMSNVAAAQAQEQVVINQINGRSWPDISLTITLTGSDGKPVPDVEASQFSVSEDGKPQEIKGLDIAQSKSIPLSLIMVMDVSGSMGGDKLPQAKAAANTFLSSMRPEDNFTLLAFSDRVRVVVPATSDLNALRAGVESLQPEGNTAAYDALYRSAELLNETPPGRRRVVVLLTDGADTSSRFSSRVAADVAQKSGALVYTIGLGADAVDGVLKGLSEPTGGKYYKAPAPGDLEAIYRSISLELSAQMQLRYVSATRVERSYRLINVQVQYRDKAGQLTVRTIRYRPPPKALLSQSQETSPPTPDRGNQASPTPTAVSPGTGTTGSVSGSSSQRVPTPLRYTGSALAALSVLLIATGLAVGFSPSSVSQRVATYVGAGTTEVETEKAPSFATRALLPFISDLGRRLAKFTPVGYIDHVQTQLLLAGPPYKMPVGGFLGIQFAVSIILILPMVLLGLYISPGIPLRWMLLGLLGAVLGFYIPYSSLTGRVRRRQTSILRALPGALDFLAINVEAGMGLDAALGEVVKRWKNPLTDEFALLLIDFQIGKPRKDGWRDLIERTRIPDLTSFVTAMIQNEQVGGSISHLLRTQAEYMRGRRRQRAEELARVAPVKMLLPMVFFIFPGILIITLGPAIPQFIDAFGGR